MSIRLDAPSYMLPEPPLEPPDVWDDTYPWDEDEYDRAEDEMNGKISRPRHLGGK